MEPPLSDQPPPDRILNAPAVAVLVAASMPALYWFQEQLPDGGLSLAFRPSSLWDGYWWPGILTSMFIHENWTHVAMNAVGALAFGPPVARLVGGTKGVVGFLLFYIACGLVAAAGYGLVHPDSFGALVGASGAVFGLMGGAIRLLGRRDGCLRALTDRRFLTTAAAIMGVNAVVGLLGLAPGMQGAQIAWEAHAFGFVCGALLIGPWTKAFGPSREAFDSPPELRDPEA
ncbi:rhomboid family intramembrane serine protease [Brevundimonas sp.]|uniref:rhomboid family intramembrane serine protease n=1 Tax=Brevundimonas sp. TaxID=1871086 RepID=UPI0027377ED0|nr:rhomboid family intramembrane serine protease [Brevundimonas sp.]MDP3802548.1 rhomboid family intramembrane serine protease [Brevundimonas sp.]